MENATTKKMLASGDAIAIIWTIDDVHAVADGDFDNEEAMLITDTLAREVLTAVKKNHDAGEGVTWNTIRYHLNAAVEAIA